jgi:hypothetical protein
MNSNGWTKSRRSSQENLPGAKDSTHQMPQVSKRKRRGRKYILRVGGFSTEREAKISIIFECAGERETATIDFSSANAWSCE